MGSITTKIWYAPVSDFEVGGIPAVPVSPDDIESAAVVTGLFDFLSGKTWKTIDIIRETGSIVCEPQGEVDGKSFLNKLSFTIAGNTKKGLGFSRYANNTDLIVIAKESDGQLRMLGSEDFGAKAEEIAPTTGATTADRKQISFVVSYPSVSPAPVVEGYDPDNPVSSSSSASA